MSSPFDNAPRSDERQGTTDQEIAPAPEIRAYLARHGGGAVRAGGGRDACDGRTDAAGYIRDRERRQSRTGDDCR